jgi:hypothetical protein
MKENQGMTRFGKLLLIGVLAGTLGLIGCSDDDDGGSAGSGGSAGTGGAAGGGGDPGLPDCPRDGDAGTACGEGEAVDDTYTTSSGSVTCDGLGVVTVPIEVVLAAKSDAIDGETDVDARIQLILSEETVADLGELVQTAVIGEASGDVDEVGGSDGRIRVCATAPCSVDFTADPDDNGAAGPIVVTTPAEVGTWTAVDGSIVLEVTDITFVIDMPVPLPLSTAGSEPACTWVEQPTVTLPPAG